MGHVALLLVLWVCFAMGGVQAHQERACTSHDRATWAEIALPFAVNRVATGESNVLVADRRGRVYHLDSHTQSVREISTVHAPRSSIRSQNPISALAMGPGAYIYVGWDNMQIVVSSDDGGSWSDGTASIDLSFFPGLTRTGQHLAPALSNNIVASRRAGNRAVANLHTRDGVGLYGVGRTDDGGRTWTVYSQSVNLNVMILDWPFESSVMWLQQGQLGQAVDGMETPTWTADIRERLNCANLGEVTALDALVGSEWLWAGTSDGKILISRDVGVTWNWVTAVPHGSRMVDMAVDGVSMSTLWLVDDAGRLWMVTLP